MVINTAYMGTSWYALELLCEHINFKVEKVLCEKKRITSKFQEVAEKHGLAISSFVEKDDFTHHLDILVERIDLFLIYQFDFIVPKKYTLSNKFFNFHSGSLRTNRGAHPIIRSILNGDKQTEITLHRINEQIDQGLVVGTLKVNISYDDDTVTLKAKTEEGLPPLLNMLVLFFEGKVNAEVVTRGKYYKPVNEEDYTISIETDTLQEMSNKIRSQKQYKGAILKYNNQRFFIKDIRDDIKNIDTHEKIIIEKNQILIKRDFGYISLIIEQSI
jgi:methionyl-tRNA formyltransferase